MAVAPAEATLDGSVHHIGDGLRPGDDDGYLYGTGEAISSLSRGVDNCQVGKLRAKQQCLRIEVRLHGAVVVEVVGAKVGKRRNPEPSSVDSVLIECVARNLHNDGVMPGRARGGELALELRSFRGGPLTGEGADLGDCPTESGE